MYGTRGNFVGRIPSSCPGTTLSLGRQIHARVPRTQRANLELYYGAANKLLKLMRSLEKKYAPYLSHFFMSIRYKLSRVAHSKSSVSLLFFFILV